MKTILLLASSVLLAAMLAGCSPGINEGIGHRITFDKNGMNVHASGKPDAHVGSDGSLVIGGKTIDVTPAQRQLLQRYYGEARGMLKSGAAVADAGVKVATQAVDNAVQNLFSKDKSTDRDKALDARSNAVESAANVLCTELQQLAATQKEIANQVPAFKPYDTGDMQCKNTVIHRP